MLKVTMLAGLFASLSMGANIAGSVNVKAETRDAQIIVEVNRDLSLLTEEGIKNTQETVRNNIRRYITSNFSNLASYSNVANAFAISINNNYIDAVRQLPGVKSVTVNKFHELSTPLSVSRGGIDPSEYGGDENISAETMKKGDNTNDGEGTVVAILDNEFYFRGETSESAAWHHDTFTELDDSVKVAFDGHPSNWKKTHAYSAAKAAKTILDKDSDKGKEGSLYFNNKVPFYFDYGGEKDSYAVIYNEDLDVSSEYTYHGSHVASITAGNDPYYKGIAPKAQLVCMKVFTTIIPSDIGKKLNGGVSSGAYDMPIMNALEDCMVLGVDGINMSLGSNLNDFDGDTITVRTLKKLADSGILTSVSAGNSGKISYSSVGGYANWTSDMVETGILSGYTNVDSATVVASGQPTKLFYEAAFDMDGKIVAYDDQIVNREYYDTEYEEEFKMSDLIDKYPEFGGHLPWVYIPGFGDAADYNGIDCVGKIAVVNRGSVSFAEKYNYAKNVGRAIALVVINNDPTSTDFNFRMSFGDDFRPSMPCALVLYKDKEEFSSRKSGSIDLIRKKLVENDKAYSVSTFSSDGATFDLDLKPEITAPGDLIRGAVPPQKSEDRTEERKYSVYEFLSGTSMSAPNYAGAQSIVLSKEAKAHLDRLAALTDADDIAAENEAYANFRNTVDLRLGSTADPMYDTKENGEDGKKSLTSPRRQGAGMVDLGSAYDTSVYFEGLDLKGNPIGKSKIALRNGEKINQGILDNISFNAYNDSSEDRSYSVKLTVMRPAIVNANDIVTGEYSYKGEVDDISVFPGYTYYIKHSIEGQPPMEKHAFGTASHNDVYYVNRDIEYYATAADCLSDKKTVIAKNRYYNAGDEANPDWKVLPGKDYQSVNDVVIASIDLADITVKGKTAKSNMTAITLKTKAGSTELYRLAGDVKKTIDEFFSAGTYLEGYLTFSSKDEEPNLSLPFMGFYGGGDNDYDDAPIFEPFEFEKDPTAVYPSDLVNDIGVSLVGKSNMDVSSMWLAGYVAEGGGIKTDEVLANDKNFTQFSGFHQLGQDPVTGEFVANAKDNLYAGNSYSTNAMIIQQFILRSVRNNYFTITEKSSGKEVYRSALTDMLFGNDDFNRNCLYKSHVDDTYLGAGYICHRAYAFVPLLNSNGQPFASGEYEVKFNYQLAGTRNWVSYSYVLHIDSDAPVVTHVNNNSDTISIEIKERNLVGMAVDKYTVDVAKDVQKVDNNYYRYDIKKDKLNEYLDSRMNYAQGSGRLFISLQDRAYGEMGVIIRFGGDAEKGYNLDEYTIVEHHSLKLPNDFHYDGTSVEVVLYNGEIGTETPVSLDGPVIVAHGHSDAPYSTGGCRGNVVTTSVTLSAIAFMAITALAVSKIIKRKKVLGGKD